MMRIGLLLASLYMLASCGEEPDVTSTSHLASVELKFAEQTSWEFTRPVADFAQDVGLSVDVTLSDPRTVLSQRLIQFDNEKLEIRKTGSGISGKDLVSEQGLEWMVFATNLHPAYPADRQRWAQSESTLASSRYEFDAALFNSWLDERDRLISLVSELTDVSESIKFDIKSGAIQEDLSAFFRARNVDDLELSRVEITEQLREFFSSYSRPLSASDASSRFVIRDLFNSAFYENKLGLSCEQARAEIDLLDSIGNHALGGMIEFTKADVTCGWRKSESQSRAVPRLSTIRNLPSLKASEFGQKIHNALFVEQDTIARFGGALLWSSAEEDSVSSWLNSTIGGPNMFPVESLFDVVFTNRRFNELSWNERLWRYWMDAEDQIVEHTLRKFPNNKIIPALIYASKIERQIRIDNRRNAILLSKGEFLEFDTKVIGSVNQLLEIENGEFYAPGILELLSISRSSLGMPVSEFRKLLQDMRSSQKPNVEITASRLLSQLGLLGEVLKFQGPDYHTGELRSVSDFRGSVVLVDMWATSCSSCIAAMPEKKALYDQYREEGFKVVSIVFDGDKNRRLVDRVIDGNDLDWTTINGEGQWEGLVDRYGFGGFPQYFLLDRDGVVTASSSDIYNHGFEFFVSAELNK